MSRTCASLLAITLLAWTALATEPAAIPKPAKNSAREPIAKTYSPEKAGEFLDGAVVAWTNEQRCGSCHTSYPFLMARPALGDANAPMFLKMRMFFENRVAHWDDATSPDRLPEGDEGVSEVVATAATLAFDDARNTGKLHPLTRQALDRMWTIQQPDGVWDWNKHELPPMEYDEYFGAVYAAMGLGYAPEGYAESASAKAGVEKLRGYFRANPPPNLHHEAWLLWSSVRLEGLMTDAQRQRTIKKLFAKQRDDGGWNLPSLGDWNRLDGTPNDPKGPSDGYATGLVIYVLRQAGVPADDRRILAGIRWLKSNQRESGRWFTRSLNADRAHYITNAGTAFAVLAIESCEVK
ncbi:MAG: terpene cyclase/mutase family protein [Planctomycetota bacterium]|nr:terpene cyclase/mutase family protein [Planctomycetota bacterium]